MQNKEIIQRNDYFIFEDKIKEESFDLSDMLSLEESFEENFINDNFDFFVDISYNDCTEKKKKKQKKTLIKRKTKRLKKNFNKFFKTKKLGKRQQEAK